MASVKRIDEAGRAFWSKNFGDKVLFYCIFLVIPAVCRTKSAYRISAKPCLMNSKAKALNKWLKWGHSVFFVVFYCFVLCSVLRRKWLSPKMVLCLPKLSVCFCVDLVRSLSVLQRFTSLFVDCVWACVCAVYRELIWPVRLVCVLFSFWHIRTHKTQKRRDITVVSWRDFKGGSRGHVAATTHVSRALLRKISCKHARKFCVVSLLVFVWFIDFCVFLQTKLTLVYSKMMDGKLQFKNSLIHNTYALSLMFFT